MSHFVLLCKVQRDGEEQDLKRGRRHSQSLLEKLEKLLREPQIKQSSSSHGLQNLFLYHHSFLGVWVRLSPCLQPAQKATPSPPPKNNSLSFPPLQKSLGREIPHPVASRRDAAPPMDLVAHTSQPEKPQQPPAPSEPHVSTRLGEDCKQLFRNWFSGGEGESIRSVTPNPGDKLCHHQPALKRDPVP